MYRTIGLSDYWSYVSDYWAVGLLGICFGLLGYSTIGHMCRTIALSDYWACLSDYWTYVSDYGHMNWTIGLISRTIGLSDYWAVGLLGRQTIWLFRPLG